MFKHLRYLFGNRRVEAAAAAGLPADYADLPLRDLIMTFYRLRGLAGYTADEIAEQIGVGILTVRPRITELFQDGKLRRTGVKRENRSGLKAHVFVSTSVPSAGYSRSGVPLVYRA